MFLSQAILAEEFEEEEEEEEEDEETEEDATNRMRNDLEEVYDNDTNRLAEVQVDCFVTIINEQALLCHNYK